MNSSAEIIAADKVVQFTYSISNAQGETVEQIDQPLSTVFMRHHRLYPAIEQALLGKRARDHITIEVPADEGSWGQSDPDLILTDDINNIPLPYRELGQELPFQNSAGDIRTFRIIALTDETVTLDGNHPFASQTMQFQISILSVRTASDEELANGLGTDSEANI